MDPRMIEEMKKREAMKRQSKIAQSKASATPIQPAQHAAPPGMAGGGQSPLQQAGMQIGKKLLGSALGPIGGILGGLFNEGGQVPMQGYNSGGWLQSIWGKPKKTSNLQQTGKYTYTSKQPQSQMSRGSGNQLNRQRLQDTSSGFQNRNQNAWQNLKKGLGFNKGGAVGPLGNPHGYNEGGMAQETPMKRVMDEQQMEIKQMSAEKAEMRKDKQMMMDEKRKQEAHEQQMKLKKAQAMAGPLSKPTGG